MTHENKITPHLYYVNTLPSKTQHIANFDAVWSKHGNFDAVR